MSNWQPTASLSNLQARARALTQVREFFAQRGVLEVETPLVGIHTVTEPNIESFKLVDEQASQHYLQTSPEYAMKRLLAAGVPDIYQICKCFRKAEQGDLHNPEFTMVEWYRLDFTLEQIMRETVDLIAELLGKHEYAKTINYLSYNDFFSHAIGTSFTALTTKDIEELAVEYGLQLDQSISFTQMVDFVCADLVGKHMSPEAITCMYHYPAEQAALAKINANDPTVAERFEVFCGGVELANGYVELVDANIQLERFKKDQAVRQSQGLDCVEIDQRLLDAQKHGLPECAGVAVGFDRLLMLAVNENRIQQVLSFNWSNA